MYVVQTTMNGKSWRNLPFTRPFASESAAWDYAKGLDEDGILTRAVRVVDASGKAVPRPRIDA